MRHFVKELVDNALNAQKQGYKKTTLKTKVDNNSLTLNGNYYVSNTINVTTNANNYNVSLSGAPKDTKIVGATSNQEGTNISSNEGFIVKVPAKEVKSTELNIKVTVTAANEIYKAYQYTPVDTSMQTVTPAIIEPTVDEVKTEIDLGLITSKVKITKYDITTNNPLPGAKLVLKNEKGEVITSWTSTVNSHVIRNLSDGTYYVSETEAPVGYEKSDEAVKFTINGSENDITVKFYNAPKETTIVNITKIDSETGNSLAGAKMIIKDSEGKEVKQFTSTEESYTITGLPYGTYTLSEIAAPNGYKKSDEVITFTLDDEHISYQIKYANYKEITVPNTKSSSLLFTILGIAIIVSGLGFVYGKTEK